MCMESIRENIDSAKEQTEQVFAEGEVPQLGRLLLS